jgi:hypothetical protein
MSHLFIASVVTNSSGTISLNSNDYDFHSSFDVIVNSDEFPNFREGSIIICKSANTEMCFPGYVTGITEIPFNCSSDIKPLCKVIAVVKDFVDPPKNPIYDNLLFKCKLADFISQVKEIYANTLDRKFANLTKIEDIKELIRFPFIYFQDLSPSDKKELIKLQESFLTTLNHTTSSTIEDGENEGKSSRVENEDEDELDSTIFVIKF